MVSCGVCVCVCARASECLFAPTTPSFLHPSVVIGLDDGYGQRCGNGGGSPVPVKLRLGEYVRAVGLDLVPKSVLVGRLSFVVDRLNASSSAKAPSASARTVTCGRAPKSLPAGSLETPKLEAAFELASYAATLKAGGNATAAQVGGLGWFNVKDCVNNRKTFAAANNTAGDKVADLAALVAKSALNSSLDAAKLGATFTYETCRSSILCVPESPVAAEEIGW